MKRIKAKAPAKINLTLEVLNKREDGFHNIKSIMQAVSLYDILTVSIEDALHTKIKLSGTSNEIPYDEKNIVYKAAELFLKKTDIKSQEIKIHIEKNIPVEAGLAGGSTDAAGTFMALNFLYENPLTEKEINNLCSKLGSDLNFCLNGGTALCTSRGEDIERLNTPNLDLTLIKPLNLGISAKEAYTKFNLLSDKTIPNNTEKMYTLLKENKFDERLIYNSLEKAVISDYKELQEIKSVLPDSIMSGSGPTCFVLKDKIGDIFDPEKFLVIENLKSVKDGVILY